MFDPKQNRLEFETEYIYFFHMTSWLCVFCLALLIFTQDLGSETRKDSFHFQL